MNTYVYTHIYKYTYCNMYRIQHIHVYMYIVCVNTKCVHIYIYTHTGIYHLQLLLETFLFRRRFKAWRCLPCSVNSRGMGLDELQEICAALLQACSLDNASCFTEQAPKAPKS